MQRTCPHPKCNDGVIVRWRGLSGGCGHTRICPSCNGKGSVDEQRDDLRMAGIVTWGTTEEDFRSFPTTQRY